MFRVDADNLDDYLGFDPKRKSDLLKLDGAIRKAAPALKRYFHEGTPAGSAGMRMKMIGYGKFQYAIKSGKTTPWPVIGVALQKNYISVYMAVTRNKQPLVKCYAGELSALRNGNNNFSFETFDEFDAAQLSKLFAEAASIFRADQQNPVRYMQGE
jgi:hypothetical protein